MIVCAVVARPQELLPVKFIPGLLFSLFSSDGAAQLDAEFEAVSCKPSDATPPGFTVQKTSRDVTSIVLEADGKKSTIAQVAGEISNVVRSAEGDYIAYFSVIPKAPRLSGWTLQRLSNGHIVHIADAQLPPKSACLSAGAKKLAFVNQSFEVVQIDLTPAFARLTYHER